MTRWFRLWHPNGPGLCLYRKPWPFSVRFGHRRALKIGAWAICTITRFGCAQAEATPPPLCNHDAFHQELRAQSAKLEALEREHADTRVLAAFGGAKMRGPRALRVISCDGGAFLEGSFGQRAWRALDGSGLCSPDEPLPGPEAHR